MTFSDRLSSLSLPTPVCKIVQKFQCKDCDSEVRFWLLLDLPQKSRQARRVNYLIEKSGKVVEMQIDNDAVAPHEDCDALRAPQDQRITLPVGVTERSFRCRRGPTCDPYVAARGWDKNSCTVLHVRSIQ